MKPIKNLKRAQEKKKAIGQFNTSTLEITKGIIKAAKKTSQPVIIGTSEGERRYLGAKQAVNLVRTFRQQLNSPVILNSDHTKSFTSFKKAVQAGYDAVHIDASAKTFSENIDLTKKCVRYANQVNPDIVVEGELGKIGGSSKLHKQKGEAEQDQLTNPEKVPEFIKRTNVDTLAISVGSIHGVYKEAPQLDLERLKKINRKTNIPLVLHGGSGLAKEQIKKAIQNGIVKINVNTEIRIAYRKALETTLRENPDQTTPYKLLPLTVNKVSELVQNKIRLFSNKKP